MFLKKDYKFFNVAESIAETSSFSRVNIGAVIVLKNEIISVGVNKKKTHPLQLRYNKKFVDGFKKTNSYIHAEIDAIIKAKHIILKNAVIYVFRKNKNGDLAMARPCKACMAGIVEAGIKSIYYTTNRGFAFEQIVL